MHTVLQILGLLSLLVSWKIIQLLSVKWSMCCFEFSLSPSLLFVAGNVARLHSLTLTFTPINQHIRPIYQKHSTSTAYVARMGYSAFWVQTAPLSTITRCERFNVRTWLLKEYLQYEYFIILYKQKESHMSYNTTKDRYPFCLYLLYSMGPRTPLKKGSSEFLLECTYNIKGKCCVR